MRAKMGLWGVLFVCLATLLPAGAGAVNPNPPAGPVKLIFIHHSTGENWLVDYHGQLGLTLGQNNYFVSDTNYGWGPEAIGDRTDFGNWWEWFRGPASPAYLADLYAESGQACEYARLLADPGGENQIVMFKSCFPNSNLGGGPFDPPNLGYNPLRGEGSWSEHHTVANAKGIYVDLLNYFVTRPDKLFVVVTAPPLLDFNTEPYRAANARAFNNWLVNDWLAGYPLRNVAVFDFYNVLTSNGGNPWANDLDWPSGNHHRLRDGQVQHLQTVGSDTAAYPSAGDDDHPNEVGNAKARGEFPALLNVFYHCWQGTGDCP